MHVLLARATSADMYATTFQAAMVPFRHSKLTELFQSYFDGDGRAVMIAAINPYSTSYEENLNVLRFAAVASQVVTARALNRAPSSHAIAQAAIPHYQQALSRPTPSRQPSTIRGQPQLASLEEGDVSELVEEDEDEDGADSADCSADVHPLDSDRAATAVGEACDDLSEGDMSEQDEEVDAFIESLLDEIRMLRQQVVSMEMDSELVIQSALQAQRDRSERQMDDMERAFSERLADEVRVLLFCPSRPQLTCMASLSPRSRGRRPR